MCGVWTALQDVQPDSGELIVYPKSHRVPPVYMADVGCEKINSTVNDNNMDKFVELIAGENGAWRKIIDNNGFEPIVYRPEKGTVLIWHANLIHAGSVRKDESLARRSFVTHHFAEGSIAYYDASGLIGNKGPRE